MPSVSGSPTQQSTSAANAAALESIDTAQFQAGDEALLQDTGRTYRLFPASVAVRDGTTTLYTRNSNPAFQGLPAGATPGRWLRSNIVDA